MSWKKKIYRLILDGTPPVLLHPILKLASAVQYATYPQAGKQALRRNDALRSVALGKTAFILATGPSVRDLDLTRIVGQDCYSVSNFFLHPLVQDLRPKMHFFAPYHEPLVLEEYVSWLRTSDQSLPKETEITLGIDTEGLVRQNDLFADRTVHYIGLEKAAMSNGVDLRYPVMRPQSVPLMVLPVLLFMGYKRIVLIGCDHNILKDYGKSVSNFYKQGADPRSNATSGANWSAGIVQHLKNALNVFTQYQMYQKYCEKHGVELIHTSPDGWLDFIPYVPLDEIPLTDPADA
ncbi:MAG: hypothetical protein QGI08_04350 [Paracoccaceae bacterium]|jgi:hypothetical protein|nr:hypothetical protein [Paracoccaceae bacterium]MDP7184934.1 hypothetical protein [Paracoccaceae bacterium]